MRVLCLLVLMVMACSPAPVSVEAPTVTAQPAEGSFIERTTVTLTSSLPATIYASTDGADPRSTSRGRLEGPSPLKVTLTQTSTLRFFASVNAVDGPLAEGTWVRVASPGSLSGVVVVGGFGVGKPVAVKRGSEVLKLGRATAAGPMPFRFVGVPTGTYALSAWLDVNGDGLFWPPVDLSSPEVTAQLDLADPTRAAVENVRLTLASPQAGQGTLRGTITLPNPPLLQSLQVSVLKPEELFGVQPAALLKLLQSGYRVATTPTDTVYPYVISDLAPGSYVPMPVLMGYASGGLAINALVTPLTTIAADQETVADFTFGPASLSGDVSLGADGGTSGLTWGVVAARFGSFSSGAQMVVMPITFSAGSGGRPEAHFAGQSLRANADLGLRVFTNLTSTDPVTDALGWAGFMSNEPAQAVVHTGTGATTVTLALP